MIKLRESRLKMVLLSERTSNAALCRSRVSLAPKIHLNGLGTYYWRDRSFDKGEHGCLWKVGQDKHGGGDTDAQAKRRSELLPERLQQRSMGQKVGDSLHSTIR